MLLTSSIDLKILENWQQGISKGKEPQGDEVKELSKQAWDTGHISVTTCHFFYLLGGEWQLGGIFAFVSFIKCFYVFKNVVFALYFFLGISSQRPSKHVEVQNALRNNLVVISGLNYKQIRSCVQKDAVTNSTFRLSDTCLLSFDHRIDTV